MFTGSGEERGVARPFPCAVLVFVKNDILGFLPHEEGILKMYPKKCSVY